MKHVIHYMHPMKKGIVWDESHQRSIGSVEEADSSVTCSQPDSLKPVKKYRNNGITMSFSWKVEIPHT